MASPSVQGLMRKWFNTCTTSHTQCTWRTPAAQATWRPTRLLDIGAPGNLYWKLDERQAGNNGEAEEAASEPYMTLSHRWGTSPLPKLDTSNREGYMAQDQNFISDLPQTFRDGIAVAHLLSIRYIWIDSLCIQQDSAEEWQIEALAMRQVFANSACNVVTGHTDSSSVSVFRNRNPVVAEAFKVRSNWEERDDTDYLIWDEKTLQEDFSGAPLSARGWVFQERLLPPRFLQFGQHQIYWKCSELFACESMPDGIPPLGNRYVIDHPRDLSTLRNLIPQDPLVPGIPMHPKVLALWKHQVICYSSCQLTHAKDKLIALSGVAKVFKERTGDQYLAGMWRSRLIELLCWAVRVNNGREGMVRPSYRCPTWSWASVDGMVTFDRLDEPQIPLIEINDTQIVSVTANDDTGEVSGGHMTVRGHLSTLKVLNEDFFDSGHIDFQVNGEAGSLDGYPFILDYPTTEKITEMELWILPVMSSFADCGNRVGVQICGIIIEKVDSRDADGNELEMPVFQRLGHFRFTPYDQIASALLGLNTDEAGGVGWGPRGAETIFRLI